MMITITNNKVGGFQPVWATFRGFTILFDNPGNSFIHVGNNLVQIRCSLTKSEDETLQLYKVLEDSLKQIGGQELTTTYLFCPLPSFSYHVTVLDGVNDDNLSTTSLEYRSDLTKFIEDLPKSMDPIPHWAKFITKSYLLNLPNKEITFKFDKLEIWGDQVLVARLKPEENSVESLKLIESGRTELGESLSKNFNIEYFKENKPHVSLGYFANQKAAKGAMGELSNWNNHFSEKLAGKTITFSQISLYAFTDMSIFFKPSDRSISY